MKWNVISLAAITSLAFTTSASCSDWKYYGGVEIKPEGIHFVFYDSASIKKTDKLIKVWSKSVFNKDIEIFASNKYRRELIVAKSKAKASGGYSTPYSKVDTEVTVSGDITFITLEETANNSALATKQKMLLEIDCTENKIRTLNIVSFENGKIEESNDVSNWQYISPDSNAETLEKILCVAK